MMNNSHRTTAVSTIIAALVLGVGLAPAPAHAGSAVLEQLKAGKIVAASLPAAGVKPGRAMAIVDAPADLVYRLIHQVEAYKHFVPRIRESRRVKPGRYVVECNMPWPVGDAWAYVDVRKGLRGQIRTVQWKMTNGTLERYEGVAWIQPYGSERSLVTYQMLAVPKTAAPDALLSHGMRTAVRTMLEALRKRVVKVQARQPVQGTRVAAQ